MHPSTAFYSEFIILYVPYDELPNARILFIKRFVDVGFAKMISSMSTIMLIKANTTFDTEMR